MYSNEAVYLFDEFDAIGARRDQINDVGEIRRVLNSFLQLLDSDDSRGLIIAATNHPDLLDSALFRRFDDVIEYAKPDDDIAQQIIANRLTSFDLSGLEWRAVLEATRNLSQADLTRASDEAAKNAVLSHLEAISTDSLITSLAERKASSRP
jgi:SpoVK/Ycf46/Vps4 family AAA+-type ATPase